MRQSDLASLLGVQPQTVSHYEKGDRDIPTDIICRLCDIFGCTADYLLGRSAIAETGFTPEEENIVLAYRRADERSKGMVDLALEPFKQGGSSAKTAGIA